MTKFESLDQLPTFPEVEKQVLKHWNTVDAFNRSLAMSEGKPEFIFYDGPPFASGHPHYGHLLAGTIKDVVTRFAHQTGHHVNRVFGWDTHGLPSEKAAEKKLGIQSKEEIEQMGKYAFCEECRSLVLKYSDVWEEIVTRSGRWVDFKNGYTTMDKNYMESVLWVFKQLWDKGLVYEGLKVLPYSTGCRSALSNFEATQNYKNVKDLAISIAFQVIDRDFELVVWTTTPWTLPSNLALVINEKQIYVKVVDNKSQRKFILMKCRLPALYNDSESYRIEEEFLGKELVGLKYNPLFPYFQNWESKGGFRVLAGNFVEESTGTGVVHCAPGFGEDDYQVCLKNGIFSVDEPLVAPIDDEGRFTDEVPDYKGVYVKDADKLIINRLKDDDRILKTEEITHPYPYCYRTDTPLLYRAVPSWYLKVGLAKEQLIANVLQTNWVPQSIRDGRFVEWLKNGRDWALSRPRYFGTPLPIWTDAEHSEFVVVGSIAELEELTGEKGIDDLHPHKIDHLAMTSKKTGKVLHRVPEVFDCWFESGSMPFAQFHLPFSGKEWKQADFIAEGLDQTRGWFYVMLVLSTLLGYKSPYKNVVVNGLILDENGEKLSKSKGNYPDPMELMDTVGADAMRLFFVNSPCVHADPVKFTKNCVNYVIKDVMMKWMNTLRFFLQQVHVNGDKFERNTQKSFDSTNILDKWILSRMNRVTELLHSEMKAYRLNSVVPSLITFVDEVTNVYVRINRENLKKGNLETLFEVLYNLSLLMAPFTPFFSEFSYRLLKPALKEEEKADSVHFLMLPLSNQLLLNDEVERVVENMMNAIKIVRYVRDRKQISVRRPLLEVKIVCKPQLVEKMREVEKFIIDEVNCYKITFATNEADYVTFSVVCDGRKLGRRLKNKFKVVQDALKLLSNEELSDLYDKSLKRSEDFVIAGETASPDEVFVNRVFNDTINDGGVKGEVIVLCDTQLIKEIKDVAIAKEVRNRIQRTKKVNKIVPSMKFEVFLDIKEGNEVFEVINSTDERVRNVLGLSFSLGTPGNEREVLAKMETSVNNVPFSVSIVKR